MLPGLQAPGNSTSWLLLRGQPRSPGTLPALAGGTGPRRGAICVNVLYRRGAWRTSPLFIACGRLAASLRMRRNSERSSSNNKKKKPKGLEGLGREGEKKKKKESKVCGLRDATWGWESGAG